MTEYERWWNDWYIYQALLTEYDRIKWHKVIKLYSTDRVWKTMKWHIKLSSCTDKSMIDDEMTGEVFKFCNDKIQIYEEKNRDD